MSYTAEDKHAEIMREIRMRWSVYPKWIADGKLDSAEAGRRIAILQSIADDYTPEAVVQAAKRPAAMMRQPKDLVTDEGLFAVTVEAGPGLVPLSGRRPPS